MTDIYGLRAIVAGNDFTRKRSNFDRKALRNEGEIYNLEKLPDIVNVLEEDAYLYQRVMNNLYFHKSTNFADNEAKEIPSKLDYNQLICLFSFG